MGHFFTIWLICLEKKLVGSSWKFCRRCTFGQQSPINFRKSSFTLAGVGAACVNVA